MLLPALSSKSGVPGPGPQDTTHRFSEIMSGATLISAYDVSYGLVETLEFPELLFLDSGGYEALKDVQALKEGDRRGVDNHPWDQHAYRKVLEDFPIHQPVVAVSFDHPDHQLPLEVQLDRADSLYPERKGLVREFLIKPEPDTAFIDLDVIQAQLSRIAGYPIIGVTDKELGDSLMDKMQKVARLRRLLDDLESEVPIHVFGSLDPLTAPLYFISGADIFDGLAWLKYAFDSGRAIYPQNFDAIQIAARKSTRVNLARMWSENYWYLTKLEDQMKRFLKDGDFSVFLYNAELLKQAWESLEESLEV